MMKLGTIAQEEAACRKRLKNTSQGQFAFHVHHEILLERLNFAPKERIAYIAKWKNPDEKALRYRLMRPAPLTQKQIDGLTEGKNMKRAINALHTQVCDPDCPWNGKTIFNKNSEAIVAAAKHRAARARRRTKAKGGRR